jgi:hypothetical protein
MEVYIVYMELLSGHEKIITKSGISRNSGTLNRGFTVCQFYNKHHSKEVGNAGMLRSLMLPIKCV